MEKARELLISIRARECKAHHSLLDQLELKSEVRHLLELIELEHQTDPTAAEAASLTEIFKSESVRSFWNEYSYQFTSNFSDLVFQHLGSRQ